MPSCTICDARAYARGLCDSHYRRARKWGSPQPELPLYARWASAPERFARRVVEGPAPDVNPSLGPCLLWTGCRTVKDYGRFSAGGRVVPAHRFAYELVHGPIPAGLVLDHLCCVHACVRVSHLEPVTSSENGRRGGAERRRTAGLGCRDRSEPPSTEAQSA